MRGKTDLTDREKIEEKIRMEERHLKEMVELALECPDPRNFPEPWRQIFAQAVLPPNRRGRLDNEHAKGLRLLGFFYPGKNTIERIPDWILEAVKHRDPSLGRSAERIRADMLRILEHKTRKYLQETKPDGPDGKED